MKLKNNYLIKIKSSNPYKLENYLDQRRTVIFFYFFKLKIKGSNPLNFQIIIFSYLNFIFINFHLKFNSSLIERQQTVITPARCKKYQSIGLSRSKFKANIRWQFCLLQRHVNVARAKEWDWNKYLENKKHVRMIEIKSRLNQKKEIKIEKMQPWTRPKKRREQNCVIHESRTCMHMSFSRDTMFKRKTTWDGR